MVSRDNVWLRHKMRHTKAYLQQHLFWWLRQHAAEDGSDSDGRELPIQPQQLILGSLYNLMMGPKIACKPHCYAWCFRDRNSFLALYLPTVQKVPSHFCNDVTCLGKIVHRPRREKQLADKISPNQSYTISIDTIGVWDDASLKIRPCNIFAFAW